MPRGQNSGFYCFELRKDGVPFQLKRIVEDQELDAQRVFRAETAGSAAHPAERLVWRHWSL